MASQLKEFARLYGKEPAHIDGHQHMHLCTNVIFSDLLPHGVRVRRNFSFSAGEKSRLNVAYRNFIDGFLARRYEVTDYFFDLADCMEPDDFARIVKLAENATVELETHPARHQELTFLVGAFRERLDQEMNRDTYANV